MHIILIDFVVIFLAKERHIPRMVNRRRKISKAPTLNRQLHFRFIYGDQAARELIA